MREASLFFLYSPTTILLPALLCWYVGRALVLPWRASKPIIYSAIAAMFLLGLSACLALTFWSEQDRAPIRCLIEFGFDVLGGMLTLAGLMAFRDVLLLAFRGIVRLILGKTSHPLTSIRGHHWLCASSWGLGVLSLILLSEGDRAAEQNPIVQEVSVPIRNLPTAFVEYRIVQLTDIHLRGAVDRDRASKLVAQVNALEPDLIAVTGDVVDGPFDNLRAGLAPLGGLHARDGIVLAVGNHENYADVDACVTEFKRLGLHVLLNEYREIHHGPDRIVIAGVTNPRGGMHGSKYYLATAGPIAAMQSDPRAAIAGAPHNVPRILLAHQPKSVREARTLGFDLALAGHTHDGQFFPWNLLVRLVYPYATGLTMDGSTAVYVGRGIGTFGPHLRLGSPPEISILRLAPIDQRTVASAL